MSSQKLFHLLNRILIFSLVCLLICLLLIIIFTNSPYFHHKITSLLIEQANKRYNLIVSIKKIQGNPFTGLSFSQFEIKNPKGEKIFIESGKLIFSPLPLLQKRISIPFISLSGLTMTITQAQGGRLQIAPFPLLTSPESWPEQEQVKSSFNLSLPNLSIQDGEVLFTDASSSEAPPPKYVLQKIQAQISFSTSGKRKQKRIYTRIKNLSFLLEPLHLPINSLQGEFSYESNHLECKQGELRTPQSILLFQGKIKLGLDPFLDLAMSSPQFSTTEFFNLAPALKLQLPPALLYLTKLQGHVNLRGTRSQLAWSTDLSLEIKKKYLSFLQASGRLDLTDLVFPKYQAQLSFEKFPLLLWLPKHTKTNLPHYLSFRVSVDGSGKKPEHLESNFIFSLSPFLLYGEQIEKFILYGRFQDQSLTISSLKIQNQAGLVELQGQIETKPPFSYETSIIFHHFNCAKIRSLALPSSRLAGEIHLHGLLGKTLPDDFYTLFSIQLSPSRLGDRYLDALKLGGEIESGRLRLSEGRLELEGLCVIIKGFISRQKIDLAFHLKNLDLALLPLDNLWLTREGIISGEGKITGSLANPLLEGIFAASQVKDKYSRIEQIKVKTKVRGWPLENLAGDLELQISSWSFHQQKMLKNLLLLLKKSGQVFEWIVQGVTEENQSVRAEGLIEIRRPNIISSLINKISLPFNKVNWENQDPIQFEIDTAAKSLNISSLTLKSLQGGLIFLEGKIEGLGKQELNLQVSHFPLQTVKNFFHWPFPLQGVTSGKASVSGTRLEPEFQGWLTIDQGRLAGLKFDTLVHSFSYGRKLLTIETTILQKEREVFSGYGQLPVDLTFSLVKNRWSLPGLKIKTRLTHLDLSFLPSFLPFLERSAGNISGLGEIKGSLANPIFSIILDFEKTSFKIKRLDQTFTIRKASIKGNNQRLNLTDLDIQAEGGLGKLFGYFELSNFRPQKIELKLKMNNWKIFYSTKTFLTLDGLISAQGSLPALKLSGKISLPEGKIQLSDLKFYQQTSPEIEIIREEEAVVMTEKKPSFFLQNLTLSLKVNAPRNLWLMGDRANLEIKGDLDLRKSAGLKPTISGTVDSVRGLYKFYGKEFIVQMANLQFQGLPEINPLLDMKTVYTAREVQIFIFITGTKNAPIITLQSEPPLPQNEIISYLVFGRPAEELNQRESATLQGEAFALLGRIVATQVLGVFGEKLPVDTIQVRASEQGTSSLELGKYLTRDVFISFGKEFGLAGTEQIRVEYYFYSNLTIETEIRSDERSGIDLIWKKDF